ncbi:MAG: polyphosphate kinase, partial [Chloroflexi bacterium]|nr:polyphosphate kinase [Chloroflexota bacterium]
IHIQSHLRDEAECGIAIVFEGLDASGKGGAIARLTGHLDARGYRVYSTGPPTDLEARQHYLQRFHAKMPARGDMVIFDRSWYGRLLVERVEGFASPGEYERAYREIREFERHYIDDGIAILKIWLHVSPEEQLRRFKERADDPFKRYKLTEEDWRNRQHWDDYIAAADEMFERTHTEEAPWVLVSGENKRHARVEVLRAVRTHMVQRCTSLAGWSVHVDGPNAAAGADGA